MGHIKQIEKCAEQVDKLLVVVSDKKELTDALCKESGLPPMPADLRVAWLKNHFKNNDKISVCHFDESGIPNFPTGEKEWSENFKEKIGKVDVKFADESYRSFNEKFFSECRFVAFDRTIIPISATMIRKEPIKYKEYIIDEAREYILKNL